MEWKEVAVEVSSLSKSYKDVLAIDNISFQIEKNEIVGLVGRNGAGKTTLMRLLSGLARPSDGSISLFGEEERDFKGGRSDVASLVEGTALYKNLSASDNLMCRALLLGYKRKEASDAIRAELEYVGLHGLYNDKHPVKGFSLGAKQKLLIAMALIGRPRLLLLDEPTNGLDPEGKKQIRELLGKINQEKDVTILISSHILSELSRLSSSFIFLEKGKLLSCISSKELKSKCGKAMIMVTSDNNAALKLLRRKRYSAFLSGSSLIVNGIKDSSRVLNDLYQSGLTLVSFHEEDGDLEDYFISLLKEEKK